MKSLKLAATLLVAAGAVWAQGRIGPGAVQGGGSLDHGSMGRLGGGLGVGRGGPQMGITDPAFANSLSFAHRLGTVVSGRLPADMYLGHGRFGHSAPIVGTIPVYAGYGGWGYGYAPPPPQTVTIVNVPPPAPFMVVNHNYTPERANPVVRDYSNANLPQTVTPAVQTVQTPVPSHPEGHPIGGKLSREASKDDPTVYLIALNEGTVYSAYAFWVEGDTLHYITTKHAHNRMRLDLVDTKLSERLNRERGVEFSLR